MSNVITVDFRKKKQETITEEPTYESGYNYTPIMRRAVYQIFQESIEMIMKYSIPEDEEHKVFITFLTHYEGVQLSEDLKEKYPHEMMIILQHQFRNLKLDGDAFLVDLSFNGRWQTIRIPFRAILEIADPAVPVAFRAI